MERYLIISRLFRRGRATEAPDPAINPELEPDETPKATLDEIRSSVEAQTKEVMAGLNGLSANTITREMIQNGVFFHLALRATAEDRDLRETLRTEASDKDSATVASHSFRSDPGSPLSLGITYAHSIAAELVRIFPEHSSPREISERLANNTAVQGHIRFLDELTVNYLPDGQSSRENTETPRGVSTF